jgi:hypothetical protein
MEAPKLVRNNQRVDASLIATSKAPHVLSGQTGAEGCHRILEICVDWAVLLIKAIRNAGNATHGVGIK